jgi:diguanylate cyclase (GGDEF)-like protein/PAS domain S-box-containing protein
MGYHQAGFARLEQDDLVLPAAVCETAQWREELLEGSLDCVYLLDADWRFQYLNARAQAEIAGGRILIGQSLWHAFPELRSSIFEPHFREAMQHRAHVDFEAYFSPLSTWYDVRASPLSEGGIGVWFRNINPRKRAVQAIVAAEERYRLVASAATDLVLEWDLATDAVFWTSALGSELGYSDEKRPLAWCTERVHPNDRARFESELSRSIISGTRLSCEARFLRNDGRYAHFEFRGVFQRDADGRAVRLICAMQDVTERNRASEALRQREAQLANIFGQALVGIMECGTDGRPTIVNARFCEILGRTAEALRLCTFHEYAHPEDLAWVEPLLRARLADGTPFQVEMRYVRPDGSTVWCRVSSSFVMDAAGLVQSSIIIAEDISESKQTEAELTASEVLYRSVLEASADCIKIIGLDGRLELMNTPGLAAMEIAQFDSVKGTRWLDLWPDESRKKVDRAFADALDGRTSRFSAFCPTAIGTPKWWDVMVSPMLDNDGSVSRILSIARDITVQRDIAAQVKWASEHDTLTGLANRRAFETHLQSAILRAMQKNARVGLLLIDLDHFKHVNDTLGHAAGDHFLTEFGKRLRLAVPDADFVARLGGDEFAVILEGEDPAAAMITVGQAIGTRLEEPIKCRGKMMAAGASIGGAIFPTDGGSANELFNNADIALYALKDSGRGGTRMFHPQMRQHAQLVSSQLTLARNAITEQSIEPHYQQKVDLRTGRITGFEALLRWHHARRGIQNPGSVAECFKDFELASRIGDLMQRQVFQDVRRWLDRDLPIGMVAINAAPVEFLRDDFAERFLARMEDSGVPPHLFELEITEHVFLVRGSDYVGRALKMLSSAGVRIALDDFGTGYSSLSHLRDYPVDVVKIDRSFIDRLSLDQEVRAIVRAVIDLTKSLSIEVVAEGIETVAQLTILKDFGCRMGQGYLFGRAVPAEQIPALITTPGPHLPI